MHPTRRRREARSGRTRPPGPAPGALRRCAGPRRRPVTRSSGKSLWTMRSCRGSEDISWDAMRYRVNRVSMRSLLALALWILAGITLAEGTPGHVLGDPSTERRGFRSYELPFVTPTDGVARPEFKSEPFYAVIL